MKKLEREQNWLSLAVRMLVVITGAYGILRVLISCANLGVNNGAVAVALLVFSAVCVYALRYEKYIKKFLLTVLAVFLAAGLVFIKALNYGMRFIINDCLSALEQPYGLSLGRVTVGTAGQKNVDETISIIFICFVVVLVIAFVVTYAHSMLGALLSVLPVFILFVSMAVIPDKWSFMLCVAYVFGVSSLHGGISDELQSLVTMGIVWLVFTICMVLVPQWGFERLAVFERLNDAARMRFSWVGGEQSTGVVSASGGINSGELGKVDGIRYTNEKILTLMTVDIGKNQYFKEFIGQQYSDNTWSAPSAQGLEADCKKELFDVMDSSEQIQSMVDGGTGNYYKIAHLFTYSIKFNFSDKEESGTYFYTDLDTYSLFERIGADSNGISEFSASSLRNAGFYTYAKNENDYKVKAYDQYLQVPEDTAELINNLMGNVKVSTAAQKENYIKYVKDYLAANYTYTLTPGKVPDGEDFIEYFLMDSKAGYCTYFATAAVMMYRCAGIPARYVEGYVVSRNRILQGRAYQTTVERKSDTGNITLDYTGYRVDVFDNSSHAWVEVYMDGYGWVEVEVTPFNGIGTGTEENDTTIRNENDSQDDLTEDDEEIEEEDEKEQESMPVVQNSQENENEDLEADIGDTAQTLSASVKIILCVLLIILFILLTIMIQYRLRFIRKTHVGQAGTDRNELLIKEYEHLEEIFEFVGIERSNTLDYEEYAAFLAESSVILKNADIKGIMEIVLKARFSDKCVTEEEYTDTVEKMRTIRKEMYKQMGKVQRLIFKYIKVL